MILKKKIYTFNRQTLQYENKVIPYRIIIGRFFKFLSISTLLALLFSAIFYMFYGSPVEGLLSVKADQMKHEFALLNTKIDSLQAQLHHRHFVSDRYYRELLELDSLPQPIRLAGTGGAETPIGIEGVAYSELIYNTANRLGNVKNQIKIQDNSYSLLLKEALIYNNELRTIPAIQPVKPAKNIWVSSTFGFRNDPFTKLKRKHEGIDFVGPPNTEIYATADGKVLNTKISRRGYGKEIIISHKFGYSTRYAHLNEILVEEGQEIKRGQLIGLMGNTGRSTGTHLHYEVRLNRKQINPVYFYADDLTAEEYVMITELSGKDKN